MAPADSARVPLFLPTRQVTAIRDAIRENRSVSVTLLNYKKDGTPFWNLFHLSPVADEAGRTVWYVGVQMEVSADVAAELCALDGGEGALSPRGSGEVASGGAPTLTRSTADSAASPDKPPAAAAAQCSGSCGSGSTFSLLGPPAAGRQPRPEPLWGCSRQRPRAQSRPRNARGTQPRLLQAAPPAATRDDA